MPHPDEGLIHAWLDGELSPEEAARVERLVREDPQWGEAAREARGLIAASSRILGALDAVPGDVMPARGRSRGPSKFSVRPWMRVAAGLVLVVGAAAVVSERIGVESAFDDVAVSQAQPEAGAAESADRGANQVPEVSLERSIDPSPEAREPITRSDALTRESGAQTGTAMQKSTDPPDAPARERTEAAGTAVPPSSADAFKSTERRAAPPPTDAPQVRNALARSASGFGTAVVMPQPQISTLSATSPVLDGCWRTLTSAASDSVLIAPRIEGSVGDTLTVRLRAAPAPAAATNSIGTATVVQRADTLAGTMIDIHGARVPFRAVRIPCGE